MWFTGCICSIIHFISVFALTHSCFSRSKHPRQPKSGIFERGFTATYWRFYFFGPCEIPGLYEGSLVMHAQSEVEDGAKWWRRRPELSCLGRLWVTVDDKQQTQTFSQGVRFMTHVFVWSFIRFLQGQKQKPGLQSIFQKKIMQDIPEQQLLEFVHSSCEKISSVSTAKLSLKPLITIQKKNKKWKKWRLYSGACMFWKRMWDVDFHANVLMHMAQWLLEPSVHAWVCFFLLVGETQCPDRWQILPHWGPK